MPIVRDTLICALALAGSTLGAQVKSGLNDPKVWLSTADRTSLVARQSEQPHFTKRAAPAGLVIAVDDTKRFQTMDGFGFALTGGSAELLMRMTPANRTAILKELFAVTPGSVGVSYLRLSIGSSDMNESVFTYDDMPPGESDPGLKKFALGPDLTDVVPVLKEILAIDPNITIMASPWSAPSWMKSNDLPKAGSLKPALYDTYAQYLVRYLQAMAAQGISIRAITIQNEPLNANNTPSMIVTADEEAAFLGDSLGPALKKAHLETKVILYDHNCDKPDYPLAILADRKAGQYASGSGFHLYEGSMDALTRVHDMYPSKDLYFTEQMVIQPDKAHPLRIAETISRLLISAPRNWSRNVLLWNLAADQNNGPHTNNGGCPVCQGAITIDGEAVTRNLAYYAIAQVAPFVRPGSTRIASETSVAGELPNVAFLTPDHHIVVVVANPGKTSEPFSLTYHGQTFPALLGAGDVATYVW